MVFGGFAWVLGERIWREKKHKGEFVTAEDGKFILQASETAEYNTSFADVYGLGSITTVGNIEDMHIDKILKLKLVDVDASLRREDLEGEKTYTKRIRI